MFPFQMPTQRKQTNNSQLKETHVGMSMVNRNIVALIMYLYETNPSIYLIKFICL